MASATSDAHGEHGGHRPTWHYAAIAIFLAVLTAIELGPLFHLYHLPPLVLLGLSVVKFFVVVAFFMHLWDDAPIFTRLFAAPLIGATLMIGVLMLLHHTFQPAPGRDVVPVVERYVDIYNGDCSSWLQSHNTNRWYCASPPLDNDRMMLHLVGPPKAEAPPAPDISKLPPDEAKAKLMEHGAEVYKSCGACHQKEGQGVPGAFPPLAGAGAFYGDAVRHAQIVAFGLSGEIQVNGVTYNSAMPAQHDSKGGTLTTYDIAAVATYERHSWGNNDGVVMPADVEAALKLGAYKP